MQQIKKNYCWADRKHVACKWLLLFTCKGFLKNDLFDFNYWEWVRNIIHFTIKIPLLVSPTGATNYSFYIILQCG